VSLMPSSGRGALGRFTIAAAIVIAFTAAATAVAGLLQFKQFAKEISGTAAIRHAPVTIPQPGDPQTLLIIGSDHRAHQAQSAANSDTMILVRLNAASSTINVMSVPRDLQVNIPLPSGGAQTAKMNASYPLGGPGLVVKTLQHAVFPRLKVNHIVDINFAGFKDLVNAMGCVYTDVDRRYFNQNIGTAATNYSSIDLQSGYQKLCGEDALAYVRYRHTDTDIVRSARQQDFIRDAKAQYGQGRLISNRDKLLTIFGKHTQTDADLHTTDGLINLFNLVAFADGHAIREVHFPAVLQPCAPPAPCYVTAEPAAEAQAYRQFMAVVGAGKATASSSSANGSGGGNHPASRVRTAAPTAGLQPDLAEGKVQATALAGHGLPVEIPKQIASGTHYEGPTAGEYPRSYTIHDAGGAPHAAYRLVLAFNATLGQYYGIQGMAWKGAPILASPSEIRYVAGRRLELHFDGHKLRLVAWRTARAVYWVSNTLSLDLTNQQMLGIAVSLTRP
jgi:polyisoprenyl-teichoic acid--peptidoglycan teichoic acid transferase